MSVVLQQPGSVLMSLSKLPYRCLWSGLPPEAVLMLVDTAEGHAAVSGLSSHLRHVNGYTPCHC